jgi:glycosyltransferase involved in cell wall biosynthesis
MFLITIYIVNYNYSKYLEEAIESVISQDLRDVEVYVIDNGSTDGSKLILSKYDNRLNIRMNSQSMLIPSINKYLREFKGKYILRLDADDSLVPGSLIRIKELIKKEDPVIGFGSYNVINSDSKMKSQRFRNFDSRINNVRHNPAHGACTLVRLQDLLKIGGYSEKYSAQDGYYIWLNLMNKGTVIGVQDIWFNYRRHGDNMTEKLEPVMKNRFSIAYDFILKTMGSEIFKNFRLYFLRPSFNIEAYNRYRDLFITYGIPKNNILCVDIDSDKLESDFDFQRIVESETECSYVAYFNLSYAQSSPNVLGMLLASALLYDTKSVSTVLPLKNSIMRFDSAGNETCAISTFIKRESEEYIQHVPIGQVMNIRKDSNSISYVEVDEYMSLDLRYLNENI